jgi:hypothetical protein
MEILIICNCFLCQQTVAKASTMKIMVKTIKHFFFSPARLPGVFQSTKAQHGETMYTLRYVFQISDLVLMDNDDELKNPNCFAGREDEKCASNFISFLMFSARSSRSAAKTSHSTATRMMKMLVVWQFIRFHYSRFNCFLSCQVVSKQHAHEVESLSASTNDDNDGDYDDHVTRQEHRNVKIISTFSTSYFFFFSLCNSKRM